MIGIRLALSERFRNRGAYLLGARIGEAAQRSGARLAWGAGLCAMAEDFWCSPLEPYPYRAWLLTLGMAALGVALAQRLPFAEERRGAQAMDGAVPLVNTLLAALAFTPSGEWHVLGKGLTAWPGPAASLGTALLYEQGAFGWTAFLLTTLLLAWRPLPPRYKNAWRLGQVTLLGLLLAGCYYASFGIGASWIGTGAFAFVLSLLIAPPAIVPRQRRRLKLVLAACTALMAFGAGMWVWAAAAVGRGSPRISASTAAVSQELLDATVAMEDGRFYEHGAFDAEALHHALRWNTRAGHAVLGGSTITQQLAKNGFLSHERTFWRKVKEAFLAVELERQWSKPCLLMQYVHTIDYGMRQYGIDSAARFYFHKTPDKLTLAESATLVGMVPYAPTRWPRRERLERGRQTALRRIAYWFPQRYSPVALEAARRVPLETLLPELPSAGPMRKEP